LLELGLDFIESALQLLFLHDVKSLQFGFRGLRDLGIHLLLEKFFAGNSFFLGLRFHQLLIHQILKGLAFDFVFLQAKLKHLCLDERQQIIVIDRLPPNHSKWFRLFNLAVVLFGLSLSLAYTRSRVENQENKKQYSGSGEVRSHPHVTSSGNQRSMLYSAGQVERLSLPVVTHSEL